MKKYLVIDEPKKDGSDDIFIELFDTAEEATMAAEYQWAHLTRREQKARCVYSCVVDETMLAEWAFDEETGEVDWLAYQDAADYPGRFDSEEYERAGTIDED